MSTDILISAGEASGDLYASALVDRLRQDLPEVRFFGAAGPRMRAAGVEPVIESESLSVVGLVEVVRHLPGIHRQYRKLLRTAKERRPAVAILTDSPDFHLRVAAQLHRMDIPVIYLVAPQAWAWRENRVHALRRDVDRLLCIFPFEQEFFRSRGVPADYIGHPLTRLIQVTENKAKFFSSHGLDPHRPLLLLLPGSRIGEVQRNLPAVLEAAALLHASHRVQTAWAMPSGLRARLGSFFQERITRPSIQIIEGQTWNALAHADLALAASGTVTIEAALLGTPMVTYYRVNPLSWWAGRRFVKAPFLSMVNLVAGRSVVPELMQADMTPQSLAREAAVLLNEPERRAAMKQELAEVAAKLSGGEDPLGRAAEIVKNFWKKDR